MIKLQHAILRQFRSFCVNLMMQEEHRLWRVGLVLQCYLAHFKPQCMLTDWCATGRNTKIRFVKSCLLLFFMQLLLLNEATVLFLQVCKALHLQHVTDNIHATQEISHFLIKSIKTHNFCTCQVLDCKFK